MKRNETDRKINLDKTPHHSLTRELIRRGFISDSDLDIFRYDDLFEKVLKDTEYRYVLLACSYSVSRIKLNKFCDESGKPIDCLFGYFKVALLSNITKIKAEAYLRSLESFW